MTSPDYLWLEPGRPDSEEGLRARVADPVWFLARQWQLGELQGEDASSPVVVASDISHVPLTYDGAPSPATVPAEALVEAEPGDWWTIGRRIRLGRAAAALLDPDDRATYAIGALPPPYDTLGAEVDGRAVFQAGVLAGDPIWAEVPAPAPDRWSTSRLNYGAAFEAGGTMLRVTDHDGGDVDWYTVDGDPAPPLVAPATRREVIPSRLDYPGAPLPRWWQIEDRAVDVGGYAPDRSHFASMLLLDVVLAHSDDWFAFPVPAPKDASVGVLVTLTNARIRDSFDQEWDIAAPAAADWSLFHTAGRPESELIVWPVAVAPQAGPVLDDVLIGVDEDANLAWAVELRADGLHLLDDAQTAQAIEETTRFGTREFRYLPSTTLPDGWHPYQRVDGDGRAGGWRQAVLADLTGPRPSPRKGPVSRLIGGPSGSGLGRGHDLDGYALPSSGVRLRRRAMLARDTAGRPVLWVERSTHPITGPPVSHLRFDVYAESVPDE
ncbi:hypothetical protein R8Z50_18825 [Longispora sp. K20-0274]|uniref:hypothetical protein n=1 Tax=Longispora sp. K20-0274 TaxID=3088255 RepID=UPI00399985AC